MIFLDIYPFMYKARFWGGLSLPGRNQGFFCLMWSSNPSLFREEAGIFVIYPGYGWLLLGCSFFPWRDCFSAFPTHLMLGGGFVAETLFIQLLVPLLREFGHRELQICCVMGGVSLGSSHAAILKPHSSKLFKKNLFIMIKDESNNNY